jgi:Protein of unknown function (DUF1554)
MRKLYFITVLLLSLYFDLSMAASGPLFTLTAIGNQLIIKPNANHYYPSMGIKLTSAHTVGNCTPHANGFCLFSASNKAPKTLIVTGPIGKETGIICLSGPAQYSCQRFSLIPNCLTSTSLCTASNGTCRVFVSSLTHNGQLGGIAGANNMCQRLADAACLGGNWNAWLSDASTNARDNIGYNGTITYVRAANPMVIVAPQERLLDTATNNLNTTIALDEIGNVASRFVWTGTSSDGTANGQDCSNWTSGNIAQTGQVGDSSTINSNWTVQGLARVCSLSLSGLYCFEAPS